MDQRTGAHVDLAERNQKLAHDLLGLAADGTLQPPPYEWIAVIAFYSALRYVNAYFWEVQQRATNSHPQRAAWVRQDAYLRTCEAEYQRLWQAGGAARYDLAFVMPAIRANALVVADLGAIEALVRAAL